MKTKQQIKDEISKLRNELIKNAHAYHSDIDVGYYETKNINFILNYCHPIDRRDFEIKYTNLVIELKKLEEKHA